MKHSLLKRRRGAVVVLVAILLVALLAMVSFCVDFGYMVRVNAELQNAADASALAGACELMKVQINGLASNSIPAATSIEAARAEAQRIATLNSAGNTTLSLLTNDIVVGYMSNPTDQQQTLNAWTTGDPLPNTIEVLMRRDSTANTPVPLFFARVLGISSWSTTAKATAAFQPASNVTGFKSTNGLNGKLLPIAIDVNYWNTFITTAKSPDGTKSDGYSVAQLTSSISAPGNVTSSTDGVPEFNDVYPNKNSPGNFGLVDIGPSDNDTPAFQNWIDNGPSPSDLSYFGDKGLQATPSQPATLKGGPGLKNTLVSNLAGIVGQPRVIPLFSSFSGSGSNTQYTIVGFAGVTIVSATGHGSKFQVIVEPTAVTDTTATTGSGSFSTFVYPSTPIGLTR
jgi:Flp pilus assembly protein TadG